MRIRELNWANVPDHAVSVYIGRRKSGKSVNILDTFYTKRNSFKFGLVFCGSKATIKDYEAHFPSSFIYYGYHSDVVGKLISKQEREVELGIAKSVFILVDDCMWEKKSILKDPNIRRLFMNGRHCKIFFVLSMQYCMDIGPGLRQQIDMTYLSREKNPQNRERLFNNYNVCFQKKEQFDSCMMQCTQDHETFVLNNDGDTASDKVEDNVNWWKSVYVKGGRGCPERPSGGSAYCASCVRFYPTARHDQRQTRCLGTFRVSPNGSWWKFHKKKYNPRHFMKSSEDDTFTVTKVGTRKTSPAKAAPAKARMPTAAAPRPILQPSAKQCAIEQLMKTKASLTSTRSTRSSDWISRQRAQNIGPRTSSFSQRPVIAT
jgi:hypothetical protein